VDVRAKVREAMRQAEGMSRTAKQPFPPKNDGNDEGGGMPPGAGAPPGMGAGMAPSNRQIPKTHKYDPQALKPLAKMLWAMSVSLGHALQAFRIFNRVKSSTVSPDGMVGGRGYIMKVTELRQKIYEAVEALSAVSDTIHDEVNAPHWKPKIAELDDADFQAIERLIGESEHMLDNPEEDIEEEEAEVEKKGRPSKNWVKKMQDKDGPSSDLPDGGDQETAPKPKNPYKFKEASTKRAYDRRDLSARIAEEVLDQILSNSSIPVQTLPGPRVQHLDRADQDQTGPFGSYNKDEPVDLKDQWSRDQGVGGEDNYPSDWVGDSSKSSTSAFPDANADSTPTEGFDFGIGRGNGNDAHGQGAGGQSQTYSPAMGDKGVYAPSAELPNDPGGKTNPDEHDSNPTIDNHLNNRIKQARELIQRATAALPNDFDGEPARADYYDGPKPNNDVNSVRSTGALPGDDTAVNESFDKDLTDTGYRYERSDEPYTKWDDSTHNMRPDDLNQRPPVQGPYAKPGN